MRSRADRDGATITASINAVARFKGLTVRSATGLVGKLIGPQGRRVILLTADRVPHAVSLEGLEVVESNPLLAAAHKVVEGETLEQRRERLWRVFEEGK